jgi:hypothetical protein
MKILRIVGIVIVAIVIGRLIGAGVVSTFRGEPTKPKSIYQLSKQEYIDLASDNCSDDILSKEYCRCFYTEFLKTNSVQDAIKMDAEAVSNPNYEFTDAQLDLAVRCL